MYTEELFVQVNGPQQRCCLSNLVSPSSNDVRFIDQLAGSPAVCLRPLNATRAADGMAFIRIRDEIIPGLSERISTKVIGCTKIRCIAARIGDLFFWMAWSYLGGDW
ncbi:hypothetical protein M407DRAFT_28831 [Tulasnella calospora MUT 4182]|uniref:Uncharacterized protein n=1 Tax=Tulasnella calospora MUT 4182 TaxID=1051891 RepID=A0A0C3KJH2_9AGAM|nr:hypothetical protein M407DRAFT_28831 [Tulasnella calospora MUT 4182]